MESSRRHWNLIAFIFALLVIPFLVNSVSAQGLMRGSGLDLAPTNPFGTPGFTAGLPQGSNSLYLNSGMFRDILGPIPNLEIGYLYQFGNKIRTGRLSLDYVLPATVWDNQAIFGEAHGEFTNFWKTLQRLLRSGNSTTSYSGYPERTDLSVGGGYRKLFGDSLMLGVNGFYDTSKLGSRWYGSGGLGFEMATLGAGNDLVELTFNYYGDIFQGRNSIINAFRNGPSNFDVSARYSIELGDYGPDLRLKATGYQFDIGTKRYGWNTEAEVRTRNGMFSVKAGTGHDPVNGWYHTVGGFVNVGIRLSNLLNGESPFDMPEPIFRSPRNLRRVLTQKVNRDYVSPPSTMARSTVSTGGGGCPPCRGHEVAPGTYRPDVRYPAAWASVGEAPPSAILLCWCRAAEQPRQMYITQLYLQNTTGDVTPYRTYKYTPVDPVPAVVGSGCSLFVNPEEEEPGEPDVPSWSFDGGVHGESMTISEGGHLCFEFRY